MRQTKVAVQGIWLLERAEVMVVVLGEEELDSGGFRRDWRLSVWVSSNAVVLVVVAPGMGPVMWMRFEGEGAWGSSSVHFSQAKM